jgi:hypothetical protein
MTTTCPDNFHDDPTGAGEPYELRATWATATGYRCRTCGFQTITLEDDV